MSGRRLDRALAGLDAHLRAQNDQTLAAARGPASQFTRDGGPANRRSRGKAALPPMPEDPTTCRWCRGRLRSLLEGEPIDYCQRGCAKNTDAPALGYCQQCRRDFHTGRRLMDSPLCWECEQREEGAAQHVGDTLPEYMDVGKNSYTDYLRRKGKADADVA